DHAAHGGELAARARAGNAAERAQARLGQRGVPAIARADHTQPAAEPRVRAGDDPAPDRLRSPAPAALEAVEGPVHPCPPEAGGRATLPEPSRRGSARSPTTTSGRTTWSRSAACLASQAIDTERPLRASA